MAPISFCFCVFLCLSSHSCRVNVNVNTKIQQHIYCANSGLGVTMKSAVNDILLFSNREQRPQGELVFGSYFNVQT